MNNTSSEPVFDAIAEELTHSILHFLECYIGNKAIAEELLQETLIRMNKGLPSFAGRSSIKTWAFSIASRVAADYLRRPDHNTKFVTLDEIDEPMDPGHEIETGLVATEMSECMRTVIDSLPDAYRTALILHDLEGLTAVETAEVCGSSLATAKIRIHRARQLLKTALERECELYHDEEDVFRCDRKG